jgi:hypothetical protein
MQAALDLQINAAGSAEAARAAAMAESDASLGRAEAAEARCAKAERLAEDARVRLLTLAADGASAQSGPGSLIADMSAVEGRPTRRGWHCRCERPVPVREIISRIFSQSNPGLCRASSAQFDISLTLCSLTLLLWDFHIAVTSGGGRRVRAAPEGC